MGVSRTAGLSKSSSVPECDAVHLSPEIRYSRFKSRDDHRHWYFKFPTFFLQPCLVLTFFISLVSKSRHSAVAEPFLVDFLDKTGRARGKRTCERESTEKLKILVLRK